MVDLYSAIGTTAILSLVGLCWKQNRDGRKNNNSNSHQYVKPNDCHMAMETQTKSFNQRFDDLKDFINIRFEDIKDFIKNGK
jgi:hypothetical protein